VEAPAEASRAAAIGRILAIDLRLVVGLVSAIDPAWVGIIQASAIGPALPA
jgi:hypothetical protein